jgi:hypothetical protein
MEGSICLNVEPDKMSIKIVDLDVRLLYWRRLSAMGKVDCFELAGMILWFPSSDHMPPHFHVKRLGHWEIRVFFMLCTHDELPFDLKWSGTLRGPSRKQLQSIQSKVLKHRATLLKEWEAKVCFK